jgi:predicted O-linked N-acetylglucosamine transferase (SPINDLY family)
MCDVHTASLQERADGWRDIQGMPDRAVADLIAEDRIDVLVELAGHTDGNRLSLLNRRVAPIQVTALGYPPTTGLATMDYKVSDPVADPPGVERYYSEKLLRMADCFWCFAPPECGDVAPAPLLKNGFVTFGCFGTLAKITPKILAAWAQILARIPDARLKLKSGTLGQPYPDRFTRERLASAGIDLSRVILEGRTSSQQFPLAYHEVDVILDTFPCNGGTTTCFALWMGVPVVSLAGEILLSRMGASMLKLLGLDEVVAESFEDYVAIAERLARSPQKIMELRQLLRPRMAASPLTDGARFTRNFETGLENVWREYATRDSHSGEAA